MTWTMLVSRLNEGEVLDRGSREEHEPRELMEVPPVTTEHET